MILFIKKALFLKKKGVLGINNRNLNFIQKYNPRKFYPLVDDKIRTKKVAEKAGLNIPKLYLIVESEYQIKNLFNKLADCSDFVIKPSRGFGGGGILVITERVNNMFRKSNGHLISFDRLSYYITNILSGIYSIGGLRDKAMIEYRVRFDPVFKSITYQGIPDIRIIVFLGVPVMAMVRLPTRTSGGKANLHQGAIGAGVDIATGITLAAVCGKKIVYEHPDTGVQVSGIKIPGWNRFLELAARCNELAGLDYIGVDMVLDKNYGPMLLELNARPGLNIQIANNCGLLPRLKSVQKNINKLFSLDEKIVFAKKSFKN